MFFKAYAHASSQLKPIEVVRSKVEFPDIKIEDPDNRIYLVPGGRFLIIFEDTRVSMWDMTQGVDDGQCVQPHRVLVEEIDPLWEVLTTCVTTPMRIRFLLSAQITYVCFLKPTHIST